MDNLEVQEYVRISLPGLKGMTTGTRPALHGPREITQSIPVFRAKTRRKIPAQSAFAGLCGVALEK